MKPLIWIIDEEWNDYRIEEELLQKHFPDCTIKHSGNDYTEDFESFGKNADAIICQVYVDLPKEIISRLNHCKIIAIYGGGYDRVAIEAAKAKGITVTYVPGYCVEDVSDYVIAAIYYFNKQIDYYLKAANKGPWGAQAVGKLNPRIHSSTLLIIGFGRIGKAVAEKARKMGMTVLIYDVKSDPGDEDKYGVQRVPLDYGLKNADYVTVHLNYHEGNHFFISMKEIGMMKDTSYLINTSRGKAINETDLMDAVNQGMIAGAMLDVIANEPPVGTEDIFHCPNIYVTPHVSYLSLESLTTLKERASYNVIQVLDGKATKDAVSQ